MLQRETLSDKTWCRGTQKFGNSRGEGGTKVPPRTENPRGWGVGDKTFHVGGGGGMDIFWNYAINTS